MCGITGTASRTPLDNAQLERVSRMNTALAHRGPDGQGEYHHPHAALAMRRLSIIDLEGGWQPLFNEDKSLALIANGEIYNYIELQQHLKSQGHHLSTGSDCETILHLYEDYGLDCVHHLRGMFAFALWDNARQRLFLARDRMGEKPLYLWQSDDALYFSSEMKALLQGIPHKPQLDPDAVNLYFHYHYVPEPRTLIAGVRKLPAGHFLTVDISSWQIQEHEYWDMADAAPLEGDPVAAIRAELDRVSELIVRSDVPVGVALSGGLDSGALAALAASKYPGVLQAFTVGYTGRPHNDERSAAQRLAEHLAIPFHEIELSTSDLVSFFPDLVHHTDDPIADIAGFGYYSVSRLARQYGVPVLLQGQGGDELFWGYGWPTESVVDTLVKQRLNGSIAPWEKLALRARYLPPVPRSVSPRSWRQWARRARLGNHPKARRWQTIVSGPPERMVFYDATDYFQWTHDRQAWLYAPEFRARLSSGVPEELFTFPRPWDQVPVTHTKLISQTYLLENGIVQGDRLSMASSIELRLPLVDYRLVETVIGHRKTQPDHQQMPKLWLREALQGVLPPWAGTGPKRGFTPPVAEWYQALIEQYGPVLRDGYLAQTGVLSAEAVEEFSRGATNLEMAYKALLLELWCKDYLEGERIEGREMTRERA